MPKPQKDLTERLVEREGATVLDAVAASILSGRSPSVAVMQTIATAIVKRVAELPDRSSPDDWPEAMLVTSVELHQIVLDEFDAELG